MICIALSPFFFFSFALPSSSQSATSAQTTNMFNSLHETLTGPHGHPGPPEGLHSDTLSESSDNATLQSLTGDDLAALGAGPIREDVRVNRKKLEALILREREATGGTAYMESLMERTKTFIQWPSRMKIGAKTKKDLYIRVYGHSPEEVNDAKLQILTDLGPHRDLRITLKMEISYTDHSHLIGCRGATIRKVMEESRCHIHFPDSNRMSKEHKSNQVTIAGSSIAEVEAARSRVRELSPLIFQLSLPSLYSPYGVHVDANSPDVFLENIQNSFHVQVTIHPPNKLQQTAISVKGCEINASTVMDAVAKIVNYFSPSTNFVNSLVVESTMEVSSIQHAFVRGVNDANVHTIMQNTGAKIIFPDLSDGNIQTIKRSRVLICGEMRSVYYARQQLLGCLPLRMVFDLSDDFHLEWEGVRSMGSDLNVNIKMINRNKSGGAGEGRLLTSLPPPVPGRSRTIQLVAPERNASNIFEARRRILGSLEPPFYASLPHSYQLRPAGGGSYNRASLHPLMLPTSPAVLSPLLSPNFWPPSPFGFPPQQRGFHSSFYSNSSGQGSSLVSSGLPSPVNPPEHNSTNKHNLTLPLGFAASTALNTPISMGSSSLSEFSPMTPMHPGVNMVNALINDFERSMELKRRAPGCERSNTLEEDEVEPPPPPPPQQEEQQQEEEEKKKETLDRAAKKYQAVQAMYAAKIGPRTRVPDDQWVGCGFSKTSLALFPTERKEPPPLMHQHSNLDDFVSRRSGGAEAKDLPSLLIANGLEKYVDMFMGEEIDLRIFGMFTENDLRRLGVTSYSARKRMLLLIAQLPSPLPTTP